jgi:hypothetical protein
MNHTIRFRDCKNNGNAWVSCVVAHGRLKPSGSRVALPSFPSCVGDESHCHLQDTQNKKNHTRVDFIFLLDLFLSSSRFIGRRLIHCGQSGGW